MNDEELHELRHRELMLLAKEAGSEGAKEVLKTLGADVDNPIEMQADFYYIRRVRRYYNYAIRCMIGVMVAVTISGIGSLVWAAMQQSG